MQQPFFFQIGTTEKHLSINMNDINMAIYSKRDTLPNVILFNTLGPRQDGRYIADELK